MRDLPGLEGADESAGNLSKHSRYSMLTVPFNMMVFHVMVIVAIPRMAEQGLKHVRE